MWASLMRSPTTPARPAPWACVSFWTPPWATMWTAPMSMWTSTPMPTARSRSTPWLPGTCPSSCGRWTACPSPPRPPTSSSRAGTAISRPRTGWCWATGPTWPIPAMTTPPISSATLPTIPTTTASLTPPMASIGPSRPWLPAPPAPASCSTAWAPSPPRPGDSRSAWISWRRKWSSTPSVRAIRAMRSRSPSMWTTPWIRPWPSAPRPSPSAWSS